MTELLTELLDAASTAYDTLGAWSLLAVGLMFSVRVYRLPFIQGLVPAVARWASFPEWVKVLVPFVLSAAGAVFLSVLGGVPIGAAVVGALVSAVGAIAGHHATAAVGEAEGQAKLAKDPAYHPSPFREVASIVVPISPLVRKVMSGDD